MNYICPGIGLIALLIALLLWWLRRNSCRHDISLRNVAATTNAYEVRVSAYTPGAQIVNASAPSNWAQTSNYPASVLWKPAGGGPIPSGNPLPGPFSIWVQNNTQPDKRVLIEWLSKAGKEVICKQLLRVGCGEKPELVPGDEEMIDTGTSSHCRCLSAETDSDEDSNEFAEPDLSVDVGQPVQTGPLQVEVPYTIEVEPPTLQFTRQWDVTVEDAMGDEQPVAISASDNLNGLATFTLPGPGHYTFYLTVTDPATCVSATDREDEEEYTDTAFAGIMIAGGSTKMGVKPDLCDPLKYHFTNESAPNLTVQDWTITKTSPSPSVLVAFQPGGDTLDFTLPNLGHTYEVCLKMTDLSTDCVNITPKAIQNQPKFRKDYNSCPGGNLTVQFYNESTSTSCAATWLWDFGDGTTSTAESPSHTYTAPFNNPYTVKLTMFVPGGQTFSTTQQIQLYYWQPEFTFEVCTDGHIIYNTSAPNPSWTFPDGTPPTATDSRIRICYIKSGPKSVKLYAINDDDGYCEVVRDLNLPDNFSLCCPHDSTRDTFEFDYKGKSYRLVTLLRCYGFPHPVVFARSKLQVFKPNKNKWGRSKPPHEQRIDLSGNLYTKKANGCHCSISHPVSGSKSKTRRVRVTKRFMPPLISRTRMRQGDVVSTHFVMIDASDLVDDGAGNEVPRRFTLSLWQHNCGCRPV